MKWITLIRGIEILKVTQIETAFTFVNCKQQIVIEMSFPLTVYPIVPDLQLLVQGHS